VANLSPPTAVVKGDHHAYFVEYGKHGGQLYIEWRAGGASDGDIVTVRLLHSDGSEVPSSQVQLFCTKRELDEALAARPLLHPPPPSELEFIILHEVAKLKFCICAAEADVKGKEYYLEFQHWDQRKLMQKGEACRTQRFRCHSRNKEATKLGTRLQPGVATLNQIGDTSSPEGSEKQLFRRAKVVLEELASLPTEVVRPVMDPLTSNIEIFEQLVRLAKVVQGQQTGVPAACSSASSSSAAAATDSPMMPAASERSTISVPSSHEPANQGSATPLQSEGSDMEDDAGLGPGMEGNCEELIDRFWSTTTSAQNVTGPAGYRSSLGGRACVLRRAGGTLEAAKALADQLDALNAALAAKLNVTLAP